MAETVFWAYTSATELRNTDTDAANAMLSFGKWIDELAIAYGRGDFDLLPFDVADFPPMRARTDGTILGNWGEGKSPRRC